MFASFLFHRSKLAIDWFHGQIGTKITILLPDITEVLALVAFVARPYNSLNDIKRSCG